MRVETIRSHRTNLNRDKRRAQILKSATDVFAAKGFHQTRISDVIAAAGIARGTFYLYFKSKGELFLGLLKELLLRLRSSVVGVDTSPDAAPLDKQLVDAVGRILQTAVDDRALATIVVREAVSLDAEAREILNNFYINVRQFIGESISNGQRLGMIRELDENIAASCVLGLVKQVIEDLVMSDFAKPLDVQQVAEVIVEFGLKGIGSVYGSYSGH
jgi:AcrR family transcriptional regulator